MVRTERLVLRPWAEADRGPFAALNADPRVTEFLPGPLSAEQSDALAARLGAHVAEHGWGLWATEHQGRFIGFVGLARPSFEAPFTPCVEVGWRLAFEAWGHGFATEAARAALAFGFGELGLDEIVSFTVPANARSIAVMERLGMRREPRDDFDHPRLPEGHRLRRHVLYRLPRPSASVAALGHLQVRWLHGGRDEPVLLLSEFDAQRFEVRKVEVFADGRLGFAGPTEAHGGTELGSAPLPTAAEISADPQFVVEPLLASEFEKAWSAALSGARR